MPGAKFLNSVDCRVSDFCEHPKPLAHKLATGAAALRRVASMKLIAARFCNVALCEFFLLFVCHVLHLLVRRLHRLPMGYRPKFCCQDWRSHPTGLGLDRTIFGGSLKKARGEGLRDPAQSGVVARSGVIKVRILSAGLSVTRPAAPTRRLSNEPV